MPAGLFFAGSLIFPFAQPVSQWINLPRLLQNILTVGPQVVFQLLGMKEISNLIAYRPDVKVVDATMRDGGLVNSP